MKSLKDILAEGVAVSSDFKLVNTVNAQGRPVTRKVRAHRKTISPEKMTSEEKPDVLASIQKFVGRQYNEEVVAEGYNDLGPEYGGAYVNGRSDDARMTEKLTRQAKAAAAKAGKTFSTSAEYRMWHARQKEKQGVAEEVEQVDELNKSTLGSYIKKAARKKSDVDSSIGDDNQWDDMSDKEQEKALRQSRMRTKGIDRASNKLTKEEVELDEVSTDGYYKAAIKDRMKQVVKLMGGDKSAKTKIDARNAGMKRVEKRTRDEMAKANSGPQKPRPPEKEPTEAERRGYGQGRYMGDSYELQGKSIVEASPKVSKQSPSMGGASKTEYDDGSSSTNYDAGPLSVQQKKDSKGDVQSNRVRYNTGIDSVQVKSYSSGVKKLTVHGPGEDSLVGAEASAKRLGVDPKKLKSPVTEGQSASMRMFKALQKIKQQRETEEARKKENEKRALTPKTVKEGNGDYEKYAQNRAKGDLLSKEISGGSDSVKSKNSVSDSAKNVTSDLTTGLASKNPEHEKRYQEDKKKLKPAESEDSLKKALEHFSRWPGSVEEAKQEDDDEDYTKHHKLDPDSGVEADQHIHVQLKKAIDSTMKPYEVTFKNGKKHSVSSPVAKTIVTAIEKLKPEHRKAAHDELHKSYDSLMAVHKAIVGK